MTPIVEQKIISKLDETMLIQQSLLGVAPSEAIFERMIIIIPYKAGGYVNKIESSFERINLRGLGLLNARYLSTKELSVEDK